MLLNTFKILTSDFVIAVLAIPAYETILYVYNGQLMEMLCERGWEQDPEFGEAVCPVRSLEVGLTAPGLLRLTLTDLDGGTQTADVFVRSEG